MGFVRSLLAVPASNPRMIEKALASEADAVFLDLEDAVAPGEKEAARGNVVRAFTGMDWRGRTPTFRVNALDTRWFYGDVIEVVEGARVPCSIIVPKVGRAEDLYALDVLLRGVEAGAGLEPGSVSLEAQIESASGLARVEEIAFWGGRLEALHFGPGDFAASVGMPGGNIGIEDAWDELYPGHRFHHAMARIATAARAGGLRVLDGPVADFRDEEALRRSCRVARSLGYDGKWCIHPAQIATVNREFSPSEEELERARRIVASYEEAGRSGVGAIAVDGQMVDEASVKMARRTLERAGE